MTIFEIGFFFLLGIELGRFVKWIFPNTVKDLNNYISSWLKAGAEHP